MKKVLMTWYGITDLRASLGIENSKGPVLSALLAENYSEVLILGYTNPEKNDCSASDFEEDLTEARKAFDSNNQSKVWAFIDRYANTEIAHTYFTKWLSNSLKENKVQTETIFHSVQLTKLNDTEGIYEVATNALDVVASFKEEREVSFYLSPGTPVMAFVWAFVALRHPQLDKRLIASPIASKPPEVVSLPKEWLEWHGRSVSSDGSYLDSYDVIFHLFGEQRMPSLLGVLQFESKRHVFINSKQYPAQVMKQFLRNSKFDEFTIDPYDPSYVKKTILDYIDKLPPGIKVGFNLTGGTKLMYAGALSASKKINATPFYFDGRHDKVIFLEDFGSEKTKKIKSVETFLKLHGNDLHISKGGNWNKIPGIEHPLREPLTRMLWKYRSKIAKLYWEIANEYADKDKPFKVKTKDVVVEYKKDKSVYILLGDNEFTFDKFVRFGTYISGGWFEEYAYLLLKPYVEEGKIYDLRIGLEIGFKENPKQTKTQGWNSLKNAVGDIYQELDLVFTDGRKLYIVECKAGNVKSDHIMKLQNIVRQFGGSSGKGLLTACFPPQSKVVKKKIDDSSNVEFIGGKYYEDQLANLF